MVSLSHEIAVSEGVADLLVQHVGLIAFKHPGGTCCWYDEVENPEEQLRKYFDILGDDWQIARIFGVVATTGGFLYSLLTLVICCSTKCKPLRAFTAFTLCVVLTLCQSLTFIVFASEFCEEYDCVFSRSSGWSAGALTCFFGSGLCHLIMKDYPGLQSVKLYQETLEMIPTSNATYPSLPRERTTVDEEEVHLDQEDSAIEDGFSSGVAVVKLFDEWSEEEEVIFEDMDDEEFFNEGVIEESIPR